jgi:hypothetical protein
MSFNKSSQIVAHLQSRLLISWSKGTSALLLLKKDIFRTEMDGDEWYCKVILLSTSMVLVGWAERMVTKFLLSGKFMTSKMQWAILGSVTDPPRTWVRHGPESTTDLGPPRTWVHQGPGSTTDLGPRRTWVHDGPGSTTDLGPPRTWVRHGSTTDVLQILVRKEYIEHLLWYTTTSSTLVGVLISFNVDDDAANTIQIEVHNKWNLDTGKEYIEQLLWYTTTSTLVVFLISFNDDNDAEDDDWWSWQMVLSGC